MANKEVKQELVKVESQALDTRPDFIQTGDRSGTEHITREDIQMPRIGLAQSLSPELVDGDPKYIEDLKLGNMFNNLTGFVYGNGPLDFIVVRADPPRWVEFIPREEGGGVKDPNVPADDPRTQFGENGELPIATKFYDFIVMILPSRELVALSFKSTGLKVARQLNGLIAMRNAPVYAGKYRITSMMTQNAKGRFAIFVVKNAGWAPDPDTYQYAKDVSENLAGKKVVIDYEQTEDPTDFDPNKLEREGDM